MSSRVRVGLIGCGGISKRHVDWFLDCPECDIAAVCDTSAERAAEVVDRVRGLRNNAAIATASDYEDVLAMSGLDGVAVLLPHALHFPVAKAALEAGKHVLVEKPMVTDVRHAFELLDTAAKAGRLLGIAYQRSYLPEYLYVHRMIRNGELGTIRFVSAHLEQAWYQGVLARREKGGGWKTDAVEAGGGQLVDSGSHTLAALLHVTGLTPSEVYASVDNCGLDVDVNSAMVVKFAEGAQAAITIGGFGNSVTEVLRVVGDRASARVFFRTVKEQSLEIDGKLVDAYASVAKSTPNENLVNAILGRDTIGADGVLGLHVAQLSEAAYASARQNRPVAIG